VALAYALVATWNIALPGIYMDAVNPDYLVVKLLNPRHQPIVAWVLQGNYLLGDRVPILIALYHGSQTFWFGLPLYWVFGTTVAGLRLTHAVFGLAVLAGLFHLLRRAGVETAFVVLACIAMALDPAFSYAFRTQSYITLQPMVWLLLSLGWMLSPPRSERAWFWCGLLAGLAVAGYFVYAFFMPVLVVATYLLTRTVPEVWRERRRWIAGLVAGGSPYLLGYGLLIRKLGGLAAFVDFFRNEQESLRAFASPLPLAGRIAHATQMVEGVVTNAWHNSMMFGQWWAVPGASLKLVLLLAVPALAWLAAELRRTASPALRMVGALPVSFFLVALVFGERLGGHHFVVVLPLLYASLVLASRDAVRGLRMSRMPVALFAAAIATLGIALNVAGQRADARMLVQTGGAGLMSDAIDRLAEDLNHETRKPFAYFPDWGLSLPVVFLTRGTIGTDSIEDYARARRRLCEGTDVMVALIDNREARTREWTARLDWDEPDVVHYRQRDGTIVFDRVTFRASDAPAHCGARR